MPLMLPLLVDLVKSWPLATVYMSNVHIQEEMLYITEGVGKKNQNYLRNEDSVSNRRTKETVLQCLGRRN